ncbi:MAG: glucose-6-phosphate isomerase, partial [Evtepia sp.]|nr:glucose-6-phosphate isomerase [Evtepia sp.]
ELSHIKAAAQQIRNQSDVLVVVGIGGSYLGARAVLELLRSPNYNLMERNAPQIFFAGNTLSSDAWNDLRLLLHNKDVSINVISKSGTTIETSAAFLLLRNLLAEKYSPEELRKRIYVTTDPEHGILKQMAETEGYDTFAIPCDIGGRYSVLTAVGLLPIAVSGIDIDDLLEGAKQMREILSHPGEHNPAWQYAAARHALYGQGKQVELLASHDPYFRCFGEWWKQLFGESEGKNGCGLFPATAEFSADLHSMGQYIQDGQRILLETVLHFDNSLTHCPLPKTPDANSGLAFLQGQDLQEVSQQAFRGTLLAHVDGGVPNLLIRLSRRCPEDVGRLIYFFQYACGLSAYLLKVNPFDQPGVEAYKMNMLALLGRPGLEKQRETLEARFC